MSFPLYSTLLNGLPKKDLTVLQKNDFMKKIKVLDTEAHNLIFALIKCYFLEHERNDLFSIPYEGKIAKERIDFDLLKFPKELRQLLYKFVLIHQKRMLEEFQRPEDHKV